MVLWEVQQLLYYGTGIVKLSKSYLISHFEKMKISNEIKPMIGLSYIKVTFINTKVSDS